MSTISSNVDLNTKYQRIAAEYAKLKAQIPVLKNAFLEEQAKNRRFSEEMQTKVAFMRKLEGEIESLEFRNEQLLKRVESLQSELDETRKVSAKEKKKAGPNHHRAHHVEPSGGDMDMLRNELEIKVRENQFLHSKIEELTSQFEEQKKNLLRKCSDLESRSDSLRAQSAQNTSNDEYSDAEDGKPEPKRSDAIYLGSGTLNGDDVESTLHAMLSDAVQKVHDLFEAFVNILRLFEQRSTVYPNDIALEPLPEATLRFGRELLKSSELFQASSAFVENVKTRILEEDTQLELTAEYLKFVPIFSHALSSCEDWQELFKKGVQTENRVSWCGPNLYSSNEEWCSTFIKFLKSLYDLKDILMADSVKSVVIFAERLAETSSLLSECSKLFSQKMFDENRLPTASKRLRCLNDCIEKALASFSRNMENFVVLLNLVASTHFLRENIASSSASEPPRADATSSSRKQSTLDKPALKETNEVKTNEPEAHGEYCPPCNCDETKTELRSAKSRIIELEKERDRIMVEAELLKMKLSGGLPDGQEATTSNASNDELHLVGAFYDKRIGVLSAEVQYLQSRAAYYQNEGADLLQRAKVEEEEKNSLSKDVIMANEKIAQLTDDLETTRKGYDDQMRSLYEHMAELNAKIESQSETITALKSNGIGGIKQGARKLLFK